MGDLQTIQGISALNKKVSSQQINKDKTTLFFIKSIFEATKKSIKDLLGVF